MVRCSWFVVRGSWVVGRGAARRISTEVFADRNFSMRLRFRVRLFNHWFSVDQRDALILVMRFDAARASLSKASQSSGGCPLSSILRNTR